MSDEEKLLVLITAIQTFLKEPVWDCHYSILEDALYQIGVYEA